MPRNAKRETLFDEDFLRRLRRLALAGRKALARSAGGAHRATDLGDGLEFADHRDYSPGDELRYVDWNIFGRLDRLQIRLFHRHTEQQVYLLVDCSGSMAAGQPSKEVFVKRCAAALAYLARVNMDQVWISPWANSAPGRELVPQRTRSSRFSTILDYLAGLPMSGPGRLADCAVQWARRSRPRGLAVLLTDAADLADLAAAVRPIARVSQQMALLHVVSPQDAGQMPGGPLALVDPEGRPDPLRLVHDTEFRAAFRQQWAKYLAHVRSAARAAGGVCVQATSDQGWEKFLLSALRLIRMATV